jgi:actin-like ATPase involved in cell morphogenesis
MANGERPAVGLSIGATNLAAVTADRAVTRKPVLTLYRGRPPEVGVPSENPNLTEPGLVITDFVDKVGDPAGIVAADGSTHRPETLVADALRALAYTATGGRALPQAVAVSYPAHWAPPAVDALRGALSRVAEWSRGPQPVVLAPDAAAALVALQANPGLPARGIIAVCDLGGSGTSLTLVDAANGYQPVARTVRHSDFSGDQIDQALLNHVVANLSAAGSFDTTGTSAIGSLTRLRAQCRNAKEQLSSSTEATLSAELPGFSGDVRLSRAELDDVLRQPLDGFVTVVRHVMESNGIGAGDLAAVAAVGGGANIPAVTTTLSQQLRVPVITAPRPHLTAAIGAALRAARGPADDSPTAVAPTMAAALDPFAEAANPTMMAEAAPEPGGAPALAWSEADDDSGIVPIRTGEYPAPQDVSATSARPPIDHQERPAEARGPAVPWYRRPAVLVIGTALVVLALAAAIMIALRHTSGGGAPTTPSPSVSTTPESPGTSAPTSESSITETTTTVSESPSTPSSTQSTTPPTSSTQSTTTQPTTTQTTTATTTQAPTTTSAPAPVVPPIPRIPGVPGFLQPGPGPGGQAG